MEQKFSSMDHDSLGRVGEEKIKTCTQKKQTKKKYNKMTSEKELSAPLHAAWQMEEHKSVQRKKQLGNLWRLTSHG